MKVYIVLVSGNEGVEWFDVCKTRECAEKLVAERLSTLKDEHYECENDWKNRYDTDEFQYQIQEFKEPHINVYEYEVKE